MRLLWWRKQRGVDPAAIEAVKRSTEDTEKIRDNWLPVLEVVEDLRVMNKRNNYAPRLAHAYAARREDAQPVTFNRRKGDKQP